MSEAAIKTLKEQQQIFDELRVQRSELQQKHALEIGAIDNVINQTWAKISALVSMMEANK